MSLKTILIQQVISGFVQSGIIDRLIDEDIQLIESVAKYAEARMQDLLGPSNTSADIGGTQWTGPLGATGPVLDPGPTGAAEVAGSTGPATLSTTAPGTDEMQERLPLGTADRGTEPQATILSTAAPVAGSDDPPIDPTDPPPDYTRLAATKG